MSKRPAKKKFQSIEEEITAVLTELILDDRTQEETRVKVLNKLLEGRESQDFFDTILEESLSLGKCPNCDHKNHWLIPENELNKRGIVTHKLDSRVKANTNAADCPQFQQACAKKKIGA